MSDNKNIDNSNYSPSLLTGGGQGGGSCYSFPKSEKLVSRKLIDQLFMGAGSRSLSAFPLRLVYQVVDDVTAHENPEKELKKSQDEDIVDLRVQENYPQNIEGDIRFQVLISVPKRCLHHAVDRNRVKRQVREAYRRNRQLFTVPEGKQLLLAFIYMDSQLHSSAEMEKKVVNLLRRMGERLS